MSISPPSSERQLSPYLVSLTLTGNNAAILGPALVSVVDWVDACVVVDTGVTDASLEVARQVAGGKLRIYSYPWRNDFSAARNFSLRLLHDLHATWGVIVDTDERLVLHGLDMRARLAQAHAPVLMVTHESGTYAKERFFRTPVQGEYVGPTHEGFVTSATREVLDTVRFSELAKTPEDYRRKFERDASLLREHTKRHPSDPRWFYYLGDTLQNLGRQREAIAAYERCTALEGWDEEGAWACYRAAECWVALADYRRAVQACARGLAVHAGIAELAWLAAFASWKLERPAQATYWAYLARSLGLYEGKGSAVKRLGFRNMHALYEGPYDVLRFSLRALGDAAGADEAERHYRLASAAREAGRHS